MRAFPRPVVVLSRCLEQDACRYNGQMTRSPVVQRLAAHVDWRPVCPEVEIGLGVPRDPIRLVAAGAEQRLLQPATGRDVTASMNAFGDALLDALAEGVDGFILKSRSPSCGITDTKVYADPLGESPVDAGPGLFGGQVLARFGDVAVEDERRLTDPRLRHHFLTKLFVHADFRAFAKHPTRAGLVALHAAQKLLLMAYQPSELRELGYIVAHVAERPIADVLRRYGEGLARALRAPARAGAVINAFSHAFGYVSDRLTPADRRRFLDALDAYRSERVGLDVPLVLLQSWTERFAEPYLERQVFLAPYPAALLEP